MESSYDNCELCLTGVTMSVILDLSYAVCIWISAAVAITYTLLGGLYSVAYTDIIQLTLIFITSVRVGFRGWAQSGSGYVYTWIEYSVGTLFRV